MTPELWRRLKPLYECALDIPAEQRAGYVAEACAGDPQLEKELQNLLADHDAETATLDEPIFDLHASSFPENKASLTEPSSSAAFASSDSLAPAAWVRSMRPSIPT